MISGPSGTGKGAICAGLIAGTKMMLSVSMTTRPPREHEEEGKSYYFTDKACFREAVAEGGFFEYAEVYGEYYGTPKAPVLAQLEKGNDVILEIEMQGAAQVKQSMPDAVLVFILPPSQEELRKRIEGRGADTPERIALRLGQAEGEIEQLERYDYSVVNDDLGGAIRDVHAIIRAERLMGAGRGAKFMSPEDMAAIRRAGRLRVGQGARKIIESYQAGNIKKQ